MIQPYALYSSVAYSSTSIAGTKSAESTEVLGAQKFSKYCDEWGVTQYSSDRYCRIYLTRYQCSF